MVIRRPRTCRERAMLTMDLIVAMAMLTIGVLPLSYLYFSEARGLRAEYCRAVAMEIVDGEMEVLAAGPGRNFPEGVTDYPVRAGAATNLPPGKFKLTRAANHLRLEWAADEKSGIGAVMREGVLK